MSETFKAIPGYGGLYEVSDLGATRSYKRPNGAVWTEPKALRGVVTRDGYRRVLLTSNGHTKSELVHRLVLTLFGPIPGPGQDTVNHIDGDKLNNVISNLEWASRAENSAHAVAHRLQAVGERKPSAKLTAEQVLSMRARYDAGGISTRALAKEFGVAGCTAHAIVAGKIWRHLLAGSSSWPAGCPQ